jgi:acid phosphatase type 7
VSLRWTTAVLAAFITVTIALTVAVGVVASTLYTGIFKSPILVGAGDIATCPSAEDEATADLLDDINGTVFTSGDNAYPDGTETNFENCYEPSWGRHKARTYPSPGNHEYHIPGASGYFDYFGAAAGDPSEGYYSYNLGDWHVVVLNSNIAAESGSAQHEWLRADLASNRASCTVAYWHHPLFSSGHHGNQPSMKPTWEALYAANVDVVVNGHDHAYERFAPQDPSGAADTTRGIREFVVGTGGAELRPFKTMQPNSEVRNADTHGVLKLTLNANSYDWEFVPVTGESFTDSGSDSCH